MSKFHSYLLLGRRHGAVILLDSSAPQRLRVRVVLQGVLSREWRERILYPNLFLLRLREKTKHVLVNASNRVDLKCYALCTMFVQMQALPCSFRITKPLSGDLQVEECFRGRTCLISKGVEQTVASTAQSAFRSTAPNAPRFQCCFEGRGEHCRKNLSKCPAPTTCFEQIGRTLHLEI